MPRWLAKILTRIRELAAARHVVFTLKSRRELASLEFGLDEEDACDVLGKLSAEDSTGRLESKATGEWMYVFKPRLAGTVLYVKVIRPRHDAITDCISLVRTPPTIKPECRLLSGVAFAYFVGRGFDRCPVAHSRSVSSPSSCLACVRSDARFSAGAPTSPRCETSPLNGGSIRRQRRLSTSRLRQPGGSSAADRCALSRWLPLWRRSSFSVQSTVSSSILATARGTPGTRTELSGRAGSRRAAREHRRCRETQTGSSYTKLHTVHG